MEILKAENHSLYPHICSLNCAQTVNFPKVEITNIIGLYNQSNYRAMMRHIQATLNI